LTIDDNGQIVCIFQMHLVLRIRIFIRPNVPIQILMLNLKI